MTHIKHAPPTMFCLLLACTLLFTAYSTLHAQTCEQGTQTSLPGITACASSVLLPQQENTYGPENLMDGNNNTAWVEGVKGNGEEQYVEFTFDRIRTFQHITISNGYAKNAATFANNSRPKLLLVETNNGRGITFTLKDTPKPRIYSLPYAVRCMFARFTIITVYSGTKWQDTAINEITIDFEDTDRDADTQELAPGLAPQKAPEQ